MYVQGIVFCGWMQLLHSSTCFSINSVYALILGYHNLATSKIVLQSSTKNIVAVELYPYVV